MRNYAKPPRTERARSAGFTTLEVVVAIAVVLIMSSIAVPQFMSMMHASKLRGAVSDFASIVQVQRLRAVDDDRYYSSYVVPAGTNRPQEAFVDIYPQNNNGTSGSGGATINPNDPAVVVSLEVLRRPAANAPATGALQAQVLPANSPVAMRDGGAPGTPVTFGPRGLPCAPTGVIGGTVCDSLGGATAYWIFFQDNITQNWGAVTVTPAGRIRRWIFNNAAAGGGWRSY